MPTIIVRASAKVSQTFSVTPENRAHQEAKKQLSRTNNFLSLIAKSSLFNCAIDLSFFIARASHSACFLEGEKRILNFRTAILTTAENSITLAKETRHPRLGNEEFSHKPLSIRALFCIRNAVLYKITLIQTHAKHGLHNRRSNLCRIAECYLRPESAQLIACWKEAPPQKVWENKASQLLAHFFENNQRKVDAEP